MFKLCEPISEKTHMRKFSALLINQICATIILADYPIGNDRFNDWHMWGSTLLKMNPTSYTDFVYINTGGLTSALPGDGAHYRETDRDAQLLKKILYQIQALYRKGNKMDSIDTKQYQKLILNSNPHGIKCTCPIYLNTFYNSKFTPTVAIKTPSSLFINKTESTGIPVKFDCTGIQAQQHNSED